MAVPDFLSICVFHCNNKLHHQSKKGDLDYTGMQLDSP